MPNHFEVNGAGFEDLLDDNSSESEVTKAELITADFPDKEDSLQDDAASVESNDRNQETYENGESADDNEETGDLMTSFLNEYGIKDGKITYENEDGSTEEVNFDDLDTKEKLSILKELTTPNLSEDEVKVINYLRSNNATMQDVIEYYSQKAVNDYIKANGPVEKEYAIDEYTDDELYIADLKSKFTDMTEEEMKADLESAKENEELFKKKVNIIRKQYKALEDEKAQEQVREQETQYSNFKESLSNQLKNFNEISMDYRDSKADSLQIEDSEKDEIFKYILSQDENGATQFFKDLNDPKKLVKLAWFALYGEDAISDISNYWKSQLKNMRKSDRKSETTVVSRDRKPQKDNFTIHRNSVNIEFGEDLL